MIRTARRNTSFPSIWTKPPTSLYRISSALPSASRSHPSNCPCPGVLSRIAAPDPSANKMAVLRSVQSTIRDRLSVPITRMRCEPIAINPWAVIIAYTNPEHAALTSNAPQRSPRPCCTVADVAGTVRSGVVVASTRASIDSGSIPAISIASRPLAMLISAVEPPI